MSNANMRIWDQVDTTDPSATKNFTGMGGFKGTAIKPTYLMRKATEVFGPCGEVTNVQCKHAHLGPG